MATNNLKLDLLQRHVERNQKSSNVCEKERGIVYEESGNCMQVLLMTSLFWRLKTKETAEDT
jgi:hypothetical protein